MLHVQATSGGSCTRTALMGLEGLHKEHPVAEQHLERFPDLVLHREGVLPVALPVTI